VASVHSTGANAGKWGFAVISLIGLQPAIASPPKSPKCLSGCEGGRRLDTMSFLERALRARDARQPSPGWNIGQPGILHPAARTGVVGAQLRLVRAQVGHGPRGENDAEMIHRPEKLEAEWRRPIAGLSDAAVRQRGGFSRISALCAANEAEGRGLGGTCQRGGCHPAPGPWLIATA